MGNSDDKTSDYILWLVWNILTLTQSRFKNPVFALLLDTADKVQQVASDACLEFAAGLLDIAQSVTPPPLAFFSGLPSGGSTQWGVYAIVLKKPGSRPKVYIGSGTSTRGGVRSRLNQYDQSNPAMIPRFVQKAFNQGYKMTHQGLLVSAHIPPTGTRVVTRSLFLALEAVFSILFWTMHSRKSTYGMPPLCPWSLDDFKYDGCCSHSPLAEGVRDYYKNLTREQIAVMEFEVEQRQKEQNAQHNARKAAKRQEMKQFDPAAYEAILAKQRAYTKQFRTPAKRLQYQQKADAKTLASKKFSCAVCKTDFRGSFDLELHNKTKKHLDMVSGKYRVTKNVAAKRYYCKLCDRAFRDSSHLKDHLKTTKHKDRAAKAAASLESSS